MRPPASRRDDGSRRGQDSRADDVECLAAGSLLLDVLLGGVRVAQRACAGGRSTGEGVAAEEVDVVELDGREAGEQDVGDREAVGGEPFDSGVDIEGVEPQMRSRAG